jgi:hypothetical protein
MPLQHCAENVQLALSAAQTPASAIIAPPSGTTTGGRHAPWMQLVPAQHIASVVHAPPATVQVGV